MQPQYLLTSQSNAVLEAIQEAGFTREEFEWQEAVSRSQHSRVDKLVHLPTGSYFLFDWYEGDVFGVGRGGRKATYAPARETSSAYSLCDDWQEMLSMVRAWLGYVKREMQPDLWNTEQYDQYREWSGADSKFTSDELKEVKAGIKRVEALLIEHSSQSEEVIADIKQNMKYLRKKAETSDRREFMYIFVGIIMTKLTDWAITAVPWQHYVTVLIQSLSRLMPGN